MAQRHEQRQVRELMSKNPVCLSQDTPLREAARVMRDRDIGDVVIVDGNAQVCGILTDRDIVIRALAQNRDADATTCGEICSKQVLKVAPDAGVEEAIKMMREAKVRRLPVTDNGHCQGVISLGDLAETLDPKSVLGEVSSAPPQH